MKNLNFQTIEDFQILDFQTKIADFQVAGSEKQISENQIIADFQISGSEYQILELQYADFLNFQISDLKFQISVMFLVHIEDVEGSLSRYVTNLGRNVADAGASSNYLDECGLSHAYNMFIRCSWSMDIIIDSWFHKFILYDMKWMFIYLKN